MDLAYDDMRYTVYWWGFSYLDYSFDVSILWSRTLGLYRWFCRARFHRVLIQIFSFMIITILYVSISLPAPVCKCSWYGFHCILFYLDLSIHVCLSLHATWHLSHHSLGGFRLSWIRMSRFQSLELVDPSGCWLERCSEGVNLQKTIQSPILLGPLRVFWVFLFLTREHLLYCL